VTPTGPRASDRQPATQPRHAFAYSFSKEIPKGETHKNSIFPADSAELMKKGSFRRQPRRAETSRDEPRPAETGVCLFPLQTVLSLNALNDLLTETLIRFALSRLGQARTSARLGSSLHSASQRPSGPAHFHPPRALSADSQGRFATATFDLRYGRVERSNAPLSCFTRGRKPERSEARAKVT